MRLERYVYSIINSYCCVEAHRQVQGEPGRGGEQSMIPTRNRMDGMSERSIMSGDIASPDHFHFSRIAFPVGYLVPCSSSSPSFRK